MRYLPREKGAATEFQCKTHNTLEVADRAGQRYCYNCLIEEHQTRAQNLAYRMMGDWAAAEDVTQEAFLSGYRAFGGFRGGSLTSWLLRIVANACRDMLRARKARPFLSLDAPSPGSETDDSPPFDPPSPDESPEEYALRRELGQAIHQGLQSLSEERRLAAVLIDVQGFSYEETAGIMNTSIGTVKSRLARARAELRDYMQKHRELLSSRFRLEE